MADTSDWATSERYVTRELERLSRTLERLEHEIQSLRGDVSALNVKAGIWGALGGAVPVVIAIALSYLRKP